MPPSWASSDHVIPATAGSPTPGRGSGGREFAKPGLGHRSGCRRGLQAVHPPSLQSLGPFPGSPPQSLVRENGKRKALPFYKEKRPLPNKKVISASMVRPSITSRRHRPVQTCVGSVTDKPALPAGGDEAGGPSHTQHTHLHPPTGSCRPRATGDPGAQGCQGSSRPLEAGTKLPASLTPRLAFSMSPRVGEAPSAPPAGERGLSEEPSSRSCPCASGQHPLQLWTSARCQA